MSAGARAGLDSNIFVYAALEPASDKGAQANALITRTSEKGVLATQALLEFVAVVRRRKPHLTVQAIKQAESWGDVFEIAPTTPAVTAAAFRLVEAHQFQVWDAVIFSAARLAGARFFFSEDLQHGVSFEGVRVINPFVATEVEIKAALGERL